MNSRKGDQKFLFALDSKVLPADFLRVREVGFKK